MSKIKIQIVFFFFHVIFFGQTKDELVFSKRFETLKSQVKLTQFNNSYTFCDEDEDGFLNFNIEQIKNDVLNEYSVKIGFDGGIYICTSASGVYLVNKLNSVPQINFMCSVPGVSWSTFDIAANLNNEIFVCESTNIHKINNSTCKVVNTYDFKLSGVVNSLSFDNDNNMYFGGFDSKVHKSSGDFSISSIWHDFRSGIAAGDFVIYSGKMFIAWNIGGSCKLYKVSLDSNNDYVSHVDLGDIPYPTYGLASELGKLYGIHPDFLYEIKFNSPDLNLPVFNTVLRNYSSEKWYGSAGKNEGVQYSANAYESFLNAQNNINPLPNSWINTVSGGQTIYIGIKNLVTDQSEIIPINLVVNTPPKYTIPKNLNNCFNDLNSNLFNLKFLENQIIGSQNNLVVTFHESMINAVNTINLLPDIYILAGNFANIYVRVYNTITSCVSYFSFGININSNPVFNQPNDLIYCHKNGGAINVEVNLQNQKEIILKGLNQNEYSVVYYQSDYDALSQINSISLPYYINTKQEKIIFSLTNKLTGCSSIGSFIVNVFDENVSFPNIVTIKTNDWTFKENSISIAVVGYADCEYSLDGISYQNENLFQNLFPGIYKVYIRDKNNCAVFNEEVLLLTYNNFFTPNQDGFNENWKIKFSENEPETEIYIYDRFGKLISNFDSNSIGWDGTYNGYLLPSDDYWFVVKRKNGKEFKGHFTLKR